VRAGVRALLQLASGDLSFRDNTWTLSGSVGSPQESASIEDELSGRPGAWNISIASPSSLSACQSRLAELTAHNAILFQSGAAIIAESAAVELDAFAQALASCPDSRVYIEGHTDSDGDEQRNLALSVARAEAVVAAMIERGIEAERLYAVGYGESQPVADNATADGKRQNRRIVVSVEAQGD
jgi:outer membrane protein OmpA-like peptidoglycan-associated protein